MLSYNDLQYCFWYKVLTKYFITKYDKLGNTHLKLCFAGVPVGAASTGTSSQPFTTAIGITNSTLAAGAAERLGVASSEHGQGEAMFFQAELIT